MPKCCIMSKFSQNSSKQKMIKMFFVVYIILYFLIFFPQGFCMIYLGKRLQKYQTP